MSVALSFLDRPVYGLPDDELFTRLDEIAALERRLAAARLETVGEITGRGLHAARGYAHPSAFLREHLKLVPAAAGQMNRLAKALPNQPDIADALTKGAISEAQASVIAAAIAAIASETTPDEQTRAAATLISQAAILAPRELKLCGHRIMAHVAPEAAEEHDRKHVERMERTAWQDRAFTVSPDGHGRYRFRGSTTAEGAAILHAVLDPLTHPRRDTNPSQPATNQPATNQPATNQPVSRQRVSGQPASGQRASGQRASGQRVGGSDAGSAAAADAVAADDAAADAAAADDAAADAAASRSGAADPPISGPGNPNAFKETRSATQRRHDALLDAFRLLLATGQLPENGGSKPQVTVTAAYDAITRQLTGGTLDTGGRMSAAETRKAACDAGIIPAILDSHSVPLDLGRERRLVNGTLRKALVLRDRGCAFPACDRPPRYCQGHHNTHWSDGGETRLSNITLLCGFHHGKVHHEDGWKVHIGPDGHPYFTPPVWLEPQQIPRRNLYHCGV